MNFVLHVQGQIEIQDFIRQLFFITVKLKLPIWAYLQDNMAGKEASSLT